MRSAIVAHLLDKLRPSPYSPLMQRLNRLVRPARLGTLRRVVPLSDRWGFDRGTPVDRYYIARFIEAHRYDICGRVLEIRESDYTAKYGASVTQRDVLDIDSANPLATIVADLAAADSIAQEQFDCFILTQTLHLIYDFQAAITHAHRILRPGGVLLATLPVISRVLRVHNDHWRFTVASSSALFGSVFGPEHISIHPYGNVLAAIAFLSGMAHEELSHQELDAYDEHYPIIIGVRAIKRKT